MRLIRKLNILAFMTALAVGPLACGDDSGSDPGGDPDGSMDGSNTDPDGSNPDGSNPDPDGGAPDADVGSCDTGGETFSYFIAALDIGQEQTAGEIAGVDIDGRDNTGSTVQYNSSEDGRPCQDRPDFKLPGGGAQGIDNSVGKVLSDLAEELPQVELDLSTELKNSIANGALMLAIRIHNVDLESGAFPQNDACVNAEILSLEVPEGWAGQDQQPMDNQTFEVLPFAYDELTGEPKVRFLRAKIENGRLTGDSVSTLPVVFEGAEETVQLGLVDAKIDLGITAEAVTGGLMGAKLEVAGLSDEVIKYDPDMLSGYKGALDVILANYADLSPVDPGTGASCQHISIGMTYSGVAATLMDPL